MLRRHVEEGAGFKGSLTCADRRDSKPLVGLFVGSFERQIANQLLRVGGGGS